MAVFVMSDIAELKQRLNSEIGVTDYLELTQDRINQFAEVTEDRQWIHTDTERAKCESPLGKTVAHGFLILSFFSYFVNSAVQIQGITKIVSSGLNSVRFLAVVPAGGRIRGRSDAERVCGRPRIHPGGMAYHRRVRGKSVPGLLGRLDGAILRVAVSRIAHS